MKGKTLLHSNRMLFIYAFIIGLQIIILYFIGFYVFPHLSVLLHVRKEVTLPPKSFYTVLVVIIFSIIALSIIFRLIGQKGILLTPVFIILIAYFILILPKTRKETVKFSPKQYYYTLLNTELKMGSSGTDVQVLQSALSTRNYIPKNLITGYFGEKTKEAVERFQDALKLPVNGLVDERTRLIFNAEFGKDHDTRYYLDAIPTLPVYRTTPEDSIGPNTPDEWGKSERIEGTEHGWTMKIGSDPVMGTAQDIFDALNVYRSKKGTRGLNWDGNLGSYAQQRANELVANGGVDDHKGFREYIGNMENRSKLGFYGLGENASCGFRLTGTHMIEWLFAGDAPHENNQLNPNWTDVGVGVSSTCVTLIFGYDRMN